MAKHDDGYYRVELTPDRVDINEDFTTLQGVSNENGEWDLTYRQALGLARRLTKFGLFAVVINSDTGDAVRAFPEYD